jgi:hypothetical protein
MKEVAQNKASPAIDTYATATTHYVQAGGTRYAYRRMGGRRITSIRSCFCSTASSSWERKCPSGLVAQEVMRKEI